MDAKDKAKELYYKYLPLVRPSDLYETYHNKAKQCALIAVEEITDQLKNLHKPAYTNFYDTNNEIGVSDGYEMIEYWQQVKEHINAL